MLLFSKMLRVGVVTVEIPPPAPDEPNVLHLMREVDAESRRLFGRALAVREVDAGSCNGCEIEITGLMGRSTTASASASTSWPRPATPICSSSPGR